MTTVLFAFVLSAAFSLIITPVFAKAGIRMGVVDFPGERKIHVKTTPRTGGLGIIASMAVVLIILKFIPTKVTSLFTLDKQYISFFIGGIISFSIGFIDDIHRQSPKIKLFFQVLAATVAFLGGIRINNFSLFGMYISFGPLSYLFTLFWFILFINTINLIDGLDGLAGGIVFFVCAVMVFLSIMGNNLLVAVLFAILGGTTLGFLKYNFNPASVFLGDGGSYFLGFAIAGLSILGSFKSQVGAITLIPLLALGVPLFDTILSPLRRFIEGRKISDPDSDHVHHRLIRMGFSVKKAVLLLYGITLSLCAAAIILVNIRDERSGLFLIIIGVAAVFAFRKLGYMDQIYSILISDWITDLSDDTGFFNRERRIFVKALQEIMRSKNLEEMWRSITQVLELLEFDKGSIYINESLKEGVPKEKTRIVFYSDRAERRKTSSLESSVILRNSAPELDWVRPPFVIENYIFSRSILRIELPLITENNDTHLGTMVLVKDMKIKPINHQTLRRVEDLRRTVIRKMEMMMVSRVVAKVKNHSPKTQIST